jgi:hypothetical protein
MRLACWTIPMRPIVIPPASAIRPVGLARPEGMPASCYRLMHAKRTGC